MGGSVKQAFSNPARGLNTASTLGLSELVRKTPFGAGGNTPFGKLTESGPNKIINAVTGQHYGENGATGPAPNAPFVVDPEQMAANQAAIEGEGNRQYQQNLDQINQTGTAETQRAKDLFGQMLPDIAENSQASHLYDSTGYGQEVGRQQANIASQVAEQEAQQRNAALASKQGFQTGALQRGMSLQDFISQANVAKSIGAQMAPQAPSSKATGTSGALSGAATGGSVGGPWGAAIGGAGGYLLGSQANQKGGK